jgi:DNA-binding transcriptional ArsR family regulator
MDEVEIFKALANETRLSILNWLKDPEANFKDEKQGGNFEHGVCVSLIQEKAGLTQSTVSTYLAVLQRAGLVTSTRVGQWTFYRRNEEAFQALSEKMKSKI